MIHSLPVLPYAYSALEPYIDRRTMQVHHERHHASYVNDLNLALEKHPELQSHSLEDLLRHIGRVPQNIHAAVRNNGGGHANHSLFWQVIGPKSSDDPTGTIGEAIRSSFGDFERFKDQFSKAAMSVFGSGWAWLVDRGDTLVIETTANQDSPLMEGRTPLCGLDLWEHAYYLQYQNRRAEYVYAWWNVINWAEVNRRLTREAVAVAAK